MPASPPLGSLASRSRLAVESLAANRNPRQPRRATHADVDEQHLESAAANARSELLPFGSVEPPADIGRWATFYAFVYMLAIATKLRVIVRDPWLRELVAIGGSNEVGEVYQAAGQPGKDSAGRCAARPPGWS